MLSGQQKKVGGIPWSTLKVKRTDPNFDHMAFWKKLSKEDQATLMELLKDEHEQKNSKK